MTNIDRNFVHVCMGQDGDKNMKFYTLDKLPGQILIVKIECDCLELKFQFTTSPCMKSLIEKLIDAMARKGEYCIKGLNQGTSISTKDGFTEFRQHTGINDDVSIMLPNGYCIKQFQELINY